MTNEAEAGLCARVHGEMWFGDVEAQGGNHVRVKLRPSAWGAVPAWSPGTVADCTVGLPDKPRYAEGMVIRQQGTTVWLGIPAMWSVTERRKATRALGGFQVRYEVAHRTGEATCVDVSAGGIRLSMDVPFPVGTKAVISFTLPGDTTPVRVLGVFLTPVSGDDAAGPVEAGVKFVGLSPAEAIRIGRYCGG